MGIIPERSKDSSSSDNNLNVSEDSDHQSSKQNDSNITKTKLKSRSSNLVRRSTGLEPRESVKTAKRKFCSKFKKFIYFWKILKVNNLARNKARALYPCTADQEDELSFEKGQVFVDVKNYAENDGWYYATM